MVQVVHLNQGLWTRGPHNFTEIIFIQTKYIKKIKTVHWSVYTSRFVFLKLFNFGSSEQLNIDCKEFQNLDSGPHFSECTRASKVLIWHCIRVNTRSSVDAEGPRDAPQIRNIALEKACNSGITFNDTHSLQSLLLDRSYALLSVSGRLLQHLYVAPFLRYYHFSSVRDCFCLWPWEVLHFWQ